MASGEAGLIRGLFSNNKRRLMTAGGDGLKKP